MNGKKKFAYGYRGLERNPKGGRGTWLLRMPGSTLRQESAEGGKKKKSQRKELVVFFVFTFPGFCEKDWTDDRKAEGAAEKNNSDKNGSVLPAQKNLSTLKVSPGYQIRLFIQYHKTLD